MAEPPRIGTAGWSIPADVADRFPTEGSALERYAAHFAAAEINSSFHRSHRPATWLRWRDAVPSNFLFSAKLSKEITHRRKLGDCGDLLPAAVAEMALLGPKLGAILVQLPPSLAFEASLASRFFAALGECWTGRVACEPRHASWFDEPAERLLEEMEIARVAADPAKLEAAGVPGGWRGFSYLRLHGSPVPYRSSYDPDRLQAYADMVAADVRAGREVWCIFDNTASSAAAGNALALQDLVRTRS